MKSGVAGTGGSATPDFIVNRHVNIIQVSEVSRGLAPPMCSWLVPEAGPDSINRAIISQYLYQMNFIHPIPTQLLARVRVIFKLVSCNFQEVYRQSHRRLGW